MKRKNKRIQEISKTITLQNHTALYFEISTKELYKRFPQSGISAFWKKFTNGKVKHDNVNNRTWFKELGLSGFYRYIIYKDRIELTLILDKVIDIPDFVNRFQSLCPIKKYHTIEINPSELVEIDSSLFGEYRLNKSEEN